MDNQISLTRNMSYCALAALVLLISTTLSAQSNYDHSSLVIVKVAKLGNDQYGQLSNALTSDDRYSLEYVCLQSGIIMLRYYHNFTQKGDVRMAVKSILRRHSKLSGLEIIFVDISQESSAQC